MIRPPYLKTGDKIAIVAPARKVSSSEMDQAIKTFSSWGLQVVTGQNLFGQENQFSGTDEQRLSDLQTMLDDKEVKAIISARGGYGTVRLIDKLNFDLFLQYPKWIIGYSDITALHSHIHTQFNIETLHAVMPVNFGDTKTNVISFETLRQALFGELQSYEIPALPLNQEGHAIGVLTGGNLSMLYSLSGSPSDIDTTGKILFLEDIDEYLYHIDMMMINLKRSGKLSGIKGLIVGGLTGMNDNTIPFGKTAEQIISTFAQELEIPVSFNFPAGHIPDNRALYLGREVELNVTKNRTTLRFVDSSEVVEKSKLLKRLLKPVLFILGFFLFTYLILHLIWYISGS